MSPSTTLFIVAYDIPSDKRRTKLHKALSGFGRWTQYSLFECFLTARQHVQLRQRIHDIINVDEDSVRLYSLCTACQERVETIGSPLPEDPDLYLV